MNATTTRRECGARGDAVTRAVARTTRMVDVDASERSGRASSFDGRDDGDDGRRAVRIVLKSAHGGCEDVTLENVWLEREMTVSTLKRERIAGAHEMCRTREEAMGCVLIYGGKVLRDDESLREALRRGRASADAYVDAEVKARAEAEARGVRREGSSSIARGGSMTRDGDGDGDGATEEEAREVEEYVVHMLARRRDEEEDGGETVDARASSASASMSSSSVTPTGVGSDVGRTEPSSTPAGRAPPTPTNARDPGTPRVFGSRETNGAGSFVESMPTSSPTTTTPTPRFNQAMDVAASPLLNATYTAAYHAAFSALSPTGSPGPGPPPLAGFTNFLNIAAGATGAGGQNAGRDATGADERRGFFQPQRRDVGVQNMRDGLPPDLNIPPGARVRVIHIHIDLKLIFKLGLMLFFLSQDASATQVALYVAVAVFVYLQQTGALAPIAQWLTGNENIGRPRDGNANGNRGNEGANANGDGEFNRPVVMPTRATHAAGYTEMPRSYVGEVKIFMYSLLASIFPSWIPPRLHAAQAAAGRREHQD